MAVYSIELCAGIGMLGEGARLGFEYLGLEYRVACYVEREIAAASQLVTLMEAECLDPAVVWSDLCTFNFGTDADYAAAKNMLVTCDKYERGNDGQKSPTSA